AGQLVRHGHFDAVAVAFGLEKQVVLPILGHDVTIDARAVGGREKQLLRFALQVGEVLVGVGVVGFVGLRAVLQREVHHVLLSHRVVDGLRGPHALEVILLGVALLKIDGAVRPVYQVGRFQQHHAPVAAPSLGRYHVGRHHIKRLAIGPAQNVRVAHAPGFADGRRADNRPVAIQGRVVVAIGAEREANSLFLL
nr:hypothetical protein [Tanacetum cinerariifolium]